MSIAGLPALTTLPPLMKVLQYAQLGIAVTNISKSIEFYSKIGFTLQSPPSLAIDIPVVVLKNKGGLELHLSTCIQGIDDEKNILMDYPLNKYPGHTHASFSVPNVLATRTYLESQEIGISGERKFGPKLRAIFARDPDRTTLEFERNYLDSEDVIVTKEMIGYPQSIDHIGIRISKPIEMVKWYADQLGFIYEVMKYEHNSEDMLKNGPPWITRTESGIDINFIINANERPVENILFANGITRPGITYAAYTIDTSVEEAAEKLRNKGITATFDEELATTSSVTLKTLATTIIPIPSRQSFFIQDEDQNLIRIIAASAATTATTN